MVKRKSTISAEELDAKFDAGEDVSEHLEVSKGFRPGWEQKRVNVDLPVWMIDQLDTQARRIGVTRQSIVKVWLSERLKAEQIGGANG
ncbi:type II toxin-antitoxin system BrnA family antitoxin [Desulfonatronum parangueonense]